MSERFVVEANHEVVGVGVRVPGGYQFFSSEPAFRFLEGTVYPRARAMQHRVTKAAEQLKQAREPLR